MVKIKFKKLHPNAKLPTKATDGSAGWDVYSPVKVNSHCPEVSSESLQARIDLGFSMELPPDYCALLCARSSFGSKYNGGIPNGVGVIDSDYRGEVSLYLIAEESFRFEKGERVGQLLILPVPQAEFVEVEGLRETKRGTGGFGSTGL